MNNYIESNCIFHNIRRVSRGLTQYFDDRYKHIKINSSQVNLLMLIDEIGKSGISDIARSIRIDRTTLARNLKHLEKDDLVKISSDSDKRKKLVDLTVNGKKKLKMAMPIWEKANKDFVHELGRGNWNIVKNSLEKVVVIIDKSN